MLNTASILLLVSCLGFFAKPGLAETSNEPPKKQKAIVQQSETEVDGGVWGIQSSKRKIHLYPSNWGQAGTFRIRSAESLPSGALTFGIGGEFYKVNNGPQLGFSSREAETIAESLFVGYSPWENITFGLMRRNSSTTFGNPQQLISSLGDFTLSAMYSFALSPIAAIAPIIDFMVASNFNNLAPAGETLSAGAGLAFTLSLFPVIDLPLFVHANIYYHAPQIRSSGPLALSAESFFNFSRFHQISLGLAGEIQLGSFIPFIELNQTTHVSSPVSFGRSPSKISLGTRILPLSNKSLCLLIGTDIAIMKGLDRGIPFSPGYQIIGQLSYTVGLSDSERKHYYTTKDVGVVDRKFIIKKKIVFKVDSAELADGSKDLLDQIARVVKENNVKKLLIAGHTDSTATEEYNLKLSKQRANTVKRYLVSQGIPASNLVAQGLGRRKPRASNQTESGRALNRRVEFFILE